MAYTIETIISEKYHSVISKGLTNTRMKDYYDIYILMTDYKNKINDGILVTAIVNTFNKRETKLDINEIKYITREIKKDEHLKKLWKNYQITAKYSKNIKYEEVSSSLETVVEIIEKELVTI